MTKITSALLLSALLAFALHVSPAQAQLARTFVSAATGNDANDCNRPTPCRTFQVAHDKTFDQGEITVLDPGGYGALTISKSISIVNDGVGEAGMLVSGGATGLEIAAPDGSYVNLRGITIQGIGFGGGVGLRFDRGFALTITNCVFRNLTGDGIIFRPATTSHLSVSNTLVADNGGNGINIEPHAATITVNVAVNRVEMVHNSGFGLLANGAFANGTVSVDVMASMAASNLSSGFAARSANGHSIAFLEVISSMSFGNGGFGFLADTVQTQITVGGSTVNANAAGIASGSVQSYGDNYAQGLAFPGHVGKT